MLANYHTHTKRCNHALGEDREYVEAAIKAGLKVLGFSDHCPFVFEDGHISPIRMLPSQVDDYFTSIDKLKKEYSKEITIYAGFESEYVPELIENQSQLLEGYPLDYMIMGEHYTEREPFDTYTGFPTADEGLLKKYVDAVIEGVETGRYIYVAHPDLMHFVGDDKIYEKHFTKLCTYLKSKNIPLEINVLGVSEDRHYTSEKFLKIAQKVGNKAIIGCDAHTPDQLLNKKGIEKCHMLAKKYNLELVDYLSGLE